VTLTKHATSIGSAGSGRYGMVERRPAHIYFRHFLFSINPPSAAAPEEVDCDARLAEDRRQGDYQRRAAGNDHGDQGRFDSSTRSSEQFGGGSDEGLGDAGHDRGRNNKEQVIWAQLNL
jgi:hypothetical protein